MKEKLNAFRQWLYEQLLRSSKRAADLSFGLSLALLLSVVINQSSPIYIDLHSQNDCVVHESPELIVSLIKSLFAAMTFLLSVILDNIDAKHKENKEDK